MSSIFDRWDDESKYPPETAHTPEEKKAVRELMAKLRAEDAERVRELKQKHPEWFQKVPNSVSSVSPS